MHMKTSVILATALAVTVSATAMAAAASHHSRHHLSMKRQDVYNAHAEAPFAPTSRRVQPPGAADCSDGWASIACNDF